ncbi:hypothetical protein M0Q97_12990 [Candidatus Dojkabacteria bacterium]|jgi:hypothetical protein|nr:hypothetical protein [Candidatus Dojkabacteria bacterium]
MNKKIIKQLYKSQTFEDFQKLMNKHRKEIKYIEGQALDEYFSLQLASEIDNEIICKLIWMDKEQYIRNYLRKKKLKRFLN